MKTTIGEFEEIVLLIVASQDQKAYGLSVTHVIEHTLKRPVTMSSVHTALYRMQEKGYLKSYVGGASKERGGRRKRYYAITALGKEVLLDAKAARNKLWELIPDVVFEK